MIIDNNNHTRKEKEARICRLYVSKPSRESHFKTKRGSDKESIAASGHLERHLMKIFPSRKEESASRKLPGNSLRRPVAACNS